MVLLLLQSTGRRARRPSHRCRCSRKQRSRQRRCIGRRQRSSGRCLRSTWMQTHPSVVRRFKEPDGECLLKLLAPPVSQSSPVQPSVQVQPAAAVQLVAVHCSAASHPSHTCSGKTPRKGVSDQSSQCTSTQLSWSQCPSSPAQFSAQVQPAVAVQAADVHWPVAAQLRQASAQQQESCFSATVQRTRLRMPF